MQTNSRSQNEWVLKARSRHHDALKAMLPADSTMNGLQAWRKLRLIEGKASRLALQLCNGPELSEEAQDKIKSQVHASVEKLFGRKLPGFFINLDPRGYALKIDESGRVPYDLHRDCGGYQILAPLID